MLPATLNFILCSIILLFPVASFADCQPGLCVELDFKAQHHLYTDTLVKIDYQLFEILENGSIVELGTYTSDISKPKSAFSSENHEDETVLKPTITLNESARSFLIRSINQHAMFPFVISIGPKNSVKYGTLKTFAMYYSEQGGAQQTPFIDLIKNTDLESFMNKENSEIQHVDDLIKKYKLDVVRFNDAGVYLEENFAPGESKVIYMANGSRLVR